jgi:hypothetical protein
MEKFPKFERQVIIKEESFTKKSFEPSFKCYCCEDTGWIKAWMVLKIIPDYNDQTDALPICTRLDSCKENIPDIIFEEELFDTRFTKEVLNFLHKEGQKDWKTTLLKGKEHYGKVQKTIDEFCQNF